MQGKNLYEYAVIRVVPKVEREEFVNVGIILFSKKAKFIKILYHLDENKLMNLSDDIDMDHLRDTLASFEKIAYGLDSGGAIARMDIPERFRWLTAVRSLCVQTSRPHSGFSDDLDKTAHNLFEELVL